MTARRWAILLIAALVVYFVLLGARGVAFIADGRPVSVGLGLAILVLPFLGVWMVWREVQFGFAVQRLAHDLAARGELPPDDLPRRPSGRLDKEAAAQRFEEVRAQVEASPQDPAAWFALAVAYDDGGDRRRARSAMRTALRQAS